MKPLATLAAAGIAISAATFGVAAPAHAGGPPNDGGGGGGGGAPAGAPSHCSDADLTVTNGPLQSANTLRRVVVSFKNTSSNQCMLSGYPDANLVTAAGQCGACASPQPGRHSECGRRVVCTGHQWVGKSLPT